MGSSHGVTTFLATEIDPPAGEDPLDWVLATNLLVQTPEQALEKLSWYLCRWQIEHFFRFAKQRLLLNKFRTPEVAHEKHWWELVCLAYIQLWLAAPLADALPKPWERYLPERPSGTLSSSSRVHNAIPDE